MRIGQNPAKSAREVARPQKVTVAVLNYIPMLSGFFAETLDVLKVCLNSLYENTAPPHDLMVFDNGSCREVQEFLLQEQQAGRIQFLILSEKNLGKGGAWDVIFPAAPGEVIAYTDSDVLFSKGWLEASLEILNTFPNVGMVTSRPFRTRPELMTETLEWAKQQPEVAIEEGQLIPWDTFLEFDLSLGSDEEEIRNRYESTRDIRLTYHGVTAQVGASHWQFVARKETLMKFVPFEMNRPMGQVLRLDEAINSSGLLRLMTPKPFAMNMSNTLPKWIRGKQANLSTTRSRWTRRILEFRPLKAILLGLNNRIFRWYNTR